MENQKQESRILVCYVPGLDTRLISSSATPTVSKLIEKYSSVEISTLPNTELVPTLLSGVYPHENLVWQVSVDARQQRSLFEKLIDTLPDIVNTTMQGIQQKLDADFDLAGIPPRRRREFTQHRFKYTRRAASPEIMKRFNGNETLFGLLGESSQYTFTYNFDELDTIARDSLANDLRFEFIEMYALDLYQHWHLDNKAGMHKALQKTDDFIAKLREGCLQSGKTLVLLSDHGQEPVRGKIPLFDVIKTSGVPSIDYNYYCELACCRFWFHTEEARKRIIPKLQEMENCQLFHYSEMQQFNICFEDNRFAEYYLMADAGYIFFPHDFYQPIANFYLGLFGPAQKSRIFNPVHRGNHGYLPHFPSEKGFMVVADEQVQPSRQSMSLIDFAPTMLDYLDSRKPSSMTGDSIL
jgi:hypothetical protein